jgi:phytanoyl-CoA hydroxylase
MAITHFSATTLNVTDVSPMREQYARDGVLVIDNFVSTQQCESLMKRADVLAQAYAVPDQPSIFSANDQRHASEQYFLESSNKVHYFFEPNAFDKSGHLKQPLTRSLNKIGHALHDVDPEFSTFSRDPRLGHLSTLIGLTHPRLIQSMYLFKQPKIGAEVTWHQDATFLHTSPSTVTGFWFALEDADESNGCLWALAGHHNGALRQRFVRTPAGVELQIVDDAPWPIEQAEPIEVAAGTLVVLHGQLPHWSAPNTTNRSRHAYAIHAVSADASYSEHNWLQRDDYAALTGFAWSSPHNASR